MATRRIVIEKGFSDGTLELSDHGRTKAHKKDVVRWSIRSHSNVGNINLIVKKPGSREIFVGPPHSAGSNWEGEISPSAPYTEYEYSIFWKDTSGTNHEYDPKIAVQPTINKFLKLGAVLLATCLGVASLIHFTKKSGNRSDAD